MTEAAVLARNRDSNELWDDCKWKMSTYFEGNMKSNTCGYWWVNSWICEHVYIVIWACMYACVCMEFLKMRMQSDYCTHYTFTLNSCVAVNYAWNVRGLNSEDFFHNIATDAYNEMSEFPRLFTWNISFSEVLGISCNIRVKIEFYKFKAI